jgi:hypothetical protein
MRAIILCLLILVPAAAAAQPARISDAVLDAMKIEAIFEVMQEEAVASGLELGDSMMPGRDLSGWQLTLTRLNAPGRVLPGFRDRFAEALPEAQADAILDYLEAPLGRRIVELELSARVALNAPDIEEVVLDRLAQMRRSGDPRADAVARFIAVNDLVEANVLGALSANAAFLTGLREGADRPGFLGQGSVLDDVWAQEPEIRAATQDWLEAFVTLAYRPLTDAEMARHIAFSESVPGQALNMALFDAFDVVFAELSRDTGAALARLMNSEEL